MKKLVIRLLLSCFLISPVWAEDISQPDVLIRVTAEKVLKALEDEQDRLKKDPDFVYQLVDEIVLPHLDFEKMAKLALGKNWRKAKGNQKQEFTDAFRQMLVRTYSKSLNEYTGQTIKYLPFKAKSDETRVTVKTEVDQKGGFPIPIDYTLYNKNGSWKVYDISIDGISLVTNYRGTFAKEIREIGIDGLIKKLNDKNKQEA